MKILKKILAVSIAVASLALAASAAKVIYSWQEVDKDKGHYDLAITTESDTSNNEETRLIATTFTFNNKLMVPVDCSTYEPITLDDVTNDPSPIFPAETKVGKLTKAYALRDYKWTTTGDNTSLLVTADTTDWDYFDQTSLDVVLISFKFAEGKTPDDIKKDDFVVNKLYLVAGQGKELGYNEPTIPTPVTFENKAVSESAADLTISVTKDDVIYLQNGTVATATATGSYTIPSTDGYVVVNTGYTAQKLYKVASGAVTEVSDNANGVLGASEASIRNDTFSGLRFKSSFLTSLRESIKEYGYLVTVESSYNTLPANYELNMALVTSGKAKKGIGFAKDAEGNITTDISYGVEGVRTIVTALATGIPASKDAVLTKIAARPYYILSDGTVIYGEVTKRSLGEVALALQQDNGDVYQNNKEYIDSIVNLIDDKNAIIDLGPLF